MKDVSQWTAGDGGAYSPSHRGTGQVLKKTGRDRLTPSTAVGLQDERTAPLRTLISNAPIQLDGAVFTPKGEVRWLGCWFTPSISTTPHFLTTLAKAQAAFVVVKRLSPGGVGLPPFLCHRLASSMLFHILGYGADAFVPTVHMTRKLSAFWHKVQRWMTNCFMSTPTDILAIEACLPPLDLLLTYKRRLAHLGVLCSPPEINPRGRETSPLGANALPSPPLTRPHGPKCEKGGQLTAPPMDPT